jgi:hypothetical protein
VTGFELFILAGFFGGFLRGLVGFAKSKVLERKSFHLQYFLVTVVVASVVGAAAGYFADTRWQVSFLAGYAGTDFLESLYKLNVVGK